MAIEPERPADRTSVPRVAVLHQGYIPHYRVRFYELLAQRQGIEYVVFHGAPPTEAGTSAARGPLTFPHCWVNNREIRIGRWTAIYQPVIRAVLEGGFDAVVLGHEIKYLSNVLLAVLCRLRGITVLYWGFGYHAKLGIGLRPGGSRLVILGATLIKNALTRLADGYLAYTHRGVGALKQIGYPEERVYVLQNTIDISAQIEIYQNLLSTDDRDIRRNFGLQDASIILLCIGRLLEARGVDVLIEAIRQLIDQRRCTRPIETVVIGSGPVKKNVEALAAGVPGVRFLGEIGDQVVVARYLKIAAAVVIPGFVGLAVNHAFAHGRPVITREHAMHGPEIDYIVNGGNGLIVAGGVDEFVEVLARFVNCDSLQKQLARGALSARDALRLERMVERFDEAVQTTIAYKRGDRRGTT
jgi:glycosyltransferase involved in cell wall biosynthesis